MMTRFSIFPCALVLATITSVTPVSLGQTTPPPTDPLAANAALCYWRAFAALPDFSQPQQKALDNALQGKPTDEQLAEVVRLSEPALHELHRGVGKTRCVWGTPFEDGILLRLPHLAKARALAKLASARAHWNFHHAKTAKGVDDLIAAMTLARQIGNEGILVTLMVDYSMERDVIQVAAANLPRMDSADLKRLNAMLDQLPTLTTMRAAILEDRRVFSESIMGGITAKSISKEDVLKLLENPNDSSLKPLEELSEQEFREGFIGMQPAFDKLLAMTDLPASEIKRAEERLLEDPNLTKPARILVARLFPPVFPAIENDVAQKVRHALLRAAIAVEQKGPEVLSEAEYRDPFEKTPFQYQKSGDGFRLQSKTVNPRTGNWIALETGKGLSE